MVSPPQQWPTCTPSPQVTTRGQMTEPSASAALTDYSRFLENAAKLKDVEKTIVVEIYRPAFIRETP